MPRGNVACEKEWEATCRGQGEEGAWKGRVVSEVNENDRTHVRTSFQDDVESEVTSGQP